MIKTLVRVKCVSNAKIKCATSRTTLTDWVKEMYINQNCTSLEIYFMTNYNKMCN